MKKQLKLRWYKDTDKYGNYIENKHKGPVGKDIDWKEFWNKNKFKGDIG